MRFQSILVCCVVLLGACNSAVEDLDNIPSGRVTQGLVVLYDFDSDSGLLSDTSPLQPSLDLEVTSADPTTFTDIGSGIRITGNTLLATNGVASKLIDTIGSSNAITVEVWLQTENLTQVGPSRIVSLSDGAYDRNFTLAQEGSTYVMRFNTSGNDKNGKPEYVTATNTVTTELTHVVFTWNGATQMASFYINGRRIQSSDTIFTGDLSTWLPYRFMIANEINAPRSWLGDIHLVAIYSHALTSLEVLRNFNDGI